MNSRERRLRRTRRKQFNYFSYSSCYLIDVITLRIYKFDIDNSKQLATMSYIIKGRAPQERHLLQFDGGAEPNPGRAAGGAILFSPDGQPLFERAEYISYATNNEAEYTGLLVGLHEAAALGIKALEIQGDSNLVVQQVAGKWKISAANLKGLHSQVLAALAPFDYVAIRHIYRDQNMEADRIATEGIADGVSFIRN